MSKPEQLLVIEPASELKFVGPFNTSVSSHMRLTNPTEHEILFKIKTTAPKKYCVRPNCGSLDSKSTIEIAIILQPFVFDPNEKNKHKFMVQSMIRPDNDLTVDQLWREVSPEQLMDSKLRCIFELPLDNNQQSATVQSAASVTTTAISQASTALIQNESNVSETSSAAIHHHDDDVASINAELKRLREGESILRQENLQLKEQILRLKVKVENSVKEQQSESSATSSKFENPYSPPQLGTQQIPMIYVLVAIAMAIFGLILGKFVL